MGKGIHINDDAFPLRKRSHWISWRDMESITNLELQEDGATNFSVLGMVMASAASAGAPITVQAHDLDLYGVSINDAGDAVHCLWMFPNDMDMDTPGVEFRVCFIHEAAGADTPVWKVHHLDLEAQQEMTNPMATATAIVTFPAHTCSTTNPSFEVTNWAPAGTEPAEDDRAMLLAVELDSLGGTAASPDEIKLFQLGIRYNLAALDGQGPGD